MASKGPSWVEGVEDSEPLSAGESSDYGATGATGGNLLTKSPCMYWSLKVVTMGLCAMMCATALIGLSMLHGIENIGKIFVAVYMIFFAVLLFMFELVQVQPWPSVDHLFQRNFGFLYSAKGKALYIIFIAFLSFGLQEPATLSFCTGLLLAFFGVGQILMYLKNPDLFD